MATSVAPDDNAGALQCALAAVHEHRDRADAQAEAMKALVAIFRTRLSSPPPTVCDAVLEVTCQAMRSHPTSLRLYEAACEVTHWLSAFACEYLSLSHHCSGSLYVYGQRSKRSVACCYLLCSTPSKYFPRHSPSRLLSVGLWLGRVFVVLPHSVAVLYLASLPGCIFGPGCLAGVWSGSAQPSV